MARNIRGDTRQERREKRRNGKQSNKSGMGPIVPYRPQVTEFVKPLVERHKLFIALMISRIMTIATGPAGTGKTYVTIGTALSLLMKNIVEQIVFTKPFFEIDSPLGPLPGDVVEKGAVQFRAARDIFIKFIGKSRLEAYEKAGKIKFEHLGSILGTTFDDSFMIMDEAQNTTPGQMRAFLTRLGKRSKAVICGDYLEQKFIEGRDGLEDVLWRFQGNSNVGFVDFDVDDIVRDDFVKDVILAYRKSKPIPVSKMTEIPDFMNTSATV